MWLTIALIVFLQWPAGQMDLVNKQLETGFSGPALGGFRYVALFVTPSLNDAFGLGYDLENYAVVRVGFQMVLGRDIPTFDVLDNAATLKGKHTEISAERIAKPSKMLPGKSKGLIKAGTVGPNTVEVYFPIPEGFWDQDKVEFKYHVQGMGLKENFKLRH